MTGPLAHLKDGDPRRGLQSLKHWTQDSYLGTQSAALLAHLDEALAATTADAPERVGREFLRTRATRPSRGGRERERELEYVAWERWGLQSQDRAVPGLWRAIVGYQVPLFDGRARRGWGAIDLVAIDDGGRPVVVELKLGNNNESPLRPFIEALAYATALRKVRVALCDEIDRAVARAGLPVGAPTDDTTPILLLAGPDYWRHAERKGRDCRTDWSIFRALLDAVASRGYPTSFGTIERRGNDVMAAPTTFPR